MSRKQWLSTLVLLLGLSTAAAVSAEGFHVGLDFIDQAMLYEDPYRVEELVPFELTGAGSQFLLDGGLAGLSEEQARRAIALRVDRAFREVDVGDPARTLNIGIHLGRAPTGQGGMSLNLILAAQATHWHNAFGHAGLDVVSLPHLYPPGSDAGIVYLENLSNIGDIVSPDLVYDSPEKVVNAVGGTAAHEIGHFFNLRHVHRGEDDPFDYMSTGGTWGMSGQDWLAPRIFTDVPDTQPGGHSSVSKLIYKAGTTWKADFSLDGTVGSADFSILSANWGQSDRLWTEGDATGDGLVGSADFSVLSAQWGASAQFSVPEPATMGLLALGGFAMVIRRRRPALRTASDVTHCISPVPQRTGFAHNLKHRGVASG